MFRVLVITPYYRPAYVYGGPSRSVPALCEGMARMGAEVTVYTTDANGHNRLAVPTRSPVEVDGVEVWYFPRVRCRFGLTFYFSPDLARKCAEQIRRFDAVYFTATWTYPLWVGAEAASRCGVPYVVSPRGSFMRWSMSQKRLKKRVYLRLFERKWVDRATAIHCTSLLEAEQTREHKFKPPIVLIPNSVSLLHGGQIGRAPDFRARLGVPEDGTLSIFVGRKHPMKRLDIMIEAFSRLVQRLPSAHLAIIGPDGGSEAELRELARRLCPEGNIHFFDLLSGEALAEGYLAADMLAMLSWRENFGMAAAEALSMGVPVLVSDGVGLASEIAATGAGRVVRAGADEIAEAWHEMLTGGGLCEMGARGRAYAARHLSLPAVAQQMIAALQTISTRPDGC